MDRGAHQVRVYRTQGGRPYLIPVSEGEGILLSLFGVSGKVWRGGNYPQDYEAAIVQLEKETGWAEVILEKA